MSGQSLDKDWTKAQNEMTAHLTNLVANSAHVSRTIDLMPAFRGDAFWDEQANSAAAFLRGGIIWPKRRIL